MHETTHKCRCYTSISCTKCPRACLKLPTGMQTLLSTFFHTREHIRSKKWWIHDFLPLREGKSPRDIPPVKTQWTCLSAYGFWNSGSLSALFQVLHPGRRDEMGPPNTYKETLWLCWQYYWLISREACRQTPRMQALDCRLPVKNAQDFLSIQCLVSSSVAQWNFEFL